MTATLEETLKNWKEKYTDWLFTAALPLWWQQGADHAQGGFHELLDNAGKPVLVARRARVQGRQSYAYAVAGVLGWNGPWQDASVHGLAYLDAKFKQPSGLFATQTAADGTVSDAHEMLYDQAFALTASAWIYRSQPNRKDMVAYAHDLMAKIETRRHPAGGYKETGDLFLSNPQMHMFEALLAWYEAEKDQKWYTLAEDIARLCLTHLIDPDTLTLHEHFDENWALAEGPKGKIIEPGHQFEWAWLLARWSKISGRADAYQMARRLFEVGASGVDKIRNVAVDEMDNAFSFTRPTARLWPQTEWLKAALILSDTDNKDERDYYLGEASLAAATLWRYLDTPVRGIWRDRILADNTLVDEPAPASSLYHIICAIQNLRDTIKG